MAPPVEIPARHQVPVGQQDRVTPPIGDQGRGIYGHHVRAVGIVGDLAEALGLTLGAEVAPRPVQALERGVVLRPDARHHLQLEAVRDGWDTQTLGMNMVFLILQAPPVQDQPVQDQPLPIEMECLPGGRHLRIAAYGQDRTHDGLVFSELEVQIYAIDQEVR